jgi:hypothetical protein
MSERPDFPCPPCPSCGKWSHWHRGQVAECCYCHATFDVDTGKGADSNVDSAPAVVGAPERKDGET